VIRKMLLVLTALVFVAGCTQSHSDMTQENETASQIESNSPSADLPSDVYAPDFRTQDPNLDRVIEAFLNKDVDQLMSLAKMRELECADGTEAYCGDDPAGTVKSYLPSGTCTTYLVPEEKLRSEMERWVEGSRYLYAAYSVSGMDEDAYFIIFANGRGDSSAKQAYLDADGKITHLGVGCGIPEPPTTFTAIAPPRE